MFNSIRFGLLLSSSAIAIMAMSAAALAQQPPPETPPPATPPQTTPPPAATPPAATPPSTTPIPQITVTAPKQPPRRAAAPRPAAARPSAGRPAAARPTAAPAPAPAQTAAQAQAAANQQVAQRVQTLDQKRDDVILPKTGSNTYQVTQQDIENNPQGSNVSISDLLYRLPGVAQDSTNQGDFHLRNEHGNVQFRLNGILLPDGVSGYSQLIETSFIANMVLVTGALNAQYGLHTSGIIDITSKSGAALAGGNISAYGGSRQTFTNAFEYGGVVDQTEYFATGRYLTTGLGLENPISAPNAIHDHSELGRFFGYTSTLLDPSTRLSTITGMSVQRFQIPNNVGQPVNPFGFMDANGGFSAYGVSNGSSAGINQNQYEKNAFAVMALQRSVENVDVQLAYFSRYSDLHFVPDPVGDMLFNGVASDVYRSSFLNGISGDGAVRINEVNTVRVGFSASGEQTQRIVTQTVEAIDPTTGFTSEPPFPIADNTSKFGWLVGGYVQDEMRLTQQLTLNVGVRFDQMFQYVDANQFSPRANITYKPFWGTTFHAGYMRTFTPPSQVLGLPANDALFVNTTNAASQPSVGSIEPERAHVVDAGVVQQLLPPCPAATTGLFTKAPIATTNCPSLEVGVDGYYKRAKDLIDDGQFGQAYMLTAFNYAKAENVGAEVAAKFKMGGFTAYANFAQAIQHATQVVSNQALFAPDVLAYIASHWIVTDHNQVYTASAGASYLWSGVNPWIDGTKISANFIYGSGLRSGFANTDHNPPYTQVNLGVSRELPAAWGLNDKPVTVRFDVVNLLDSTYVIRDGTGIGVFAPQFGPRRGYYVGISQKL
jgi:outer membrane receptor protein involved in Fe transport